ncbi:TIGR01777 family oxidoreductase [Agromyces marinus]|uniref:Epimerase n=1 Tax=Agromyces marinus TaxID=1389020 RepID=A0ABM8GY78_9MICO|nr:TIGR01777 family oxidoreductase [Agromyces marinus]UIP58305.1 Epimerase family protein [Agromyces marinus]BDZ53448.1 epimerase [Agromyces marinus]
MRVLVAGASGFIGSAVRERLAGDGHDVVRLVRRRAQSDDEVSWSPGSGIIDFTIMDRVDAVLNLAGASLQRLPWTRRYRNEILESRVRATRTLADAMRKARTPPAVFLSGSAVGYYGDRPGELLTEHSSAGTGFLAEVVARWEAAARLAPEQTRTVLLRSGIVIGPGGVMRRLRLLSTLGVSGRLGTGGQHWPWISLDDEVGAIVRLLDSHASGPVNLVGPTPATADRVMAALAERLHRPYAIPVPERVLELAIGRAADDLILSSQKVRPQRLIDDGYRFAHPSIESALDAMLSADPARPNGPAR